MSADEFLMLNDRKFKHRNFLGSLELTPFIFGKVRKIIGYVRVAFEQQSESSEIVGVETAQNTKCF